MPLRGTGCTNGFWRSVGRRPILIPLSTVRKTTQLSHLVDIFDLPSGSGLFQSATDQSLGRTLDHPAADRLARVQSMAVVQPPGVSGEVARQLAQGRVPRQFGGLCQGHSDVVAEPGSAVGQHLAPSSSARF